MFPRPATPNAEIEGAGGAYVRRRLSFGGRDLVSGDRLTAEEVARIPIHNLHALVNTNVIELFPKAPSGERFLVAAGDDKFHVVEGARLNDKPLTRAKAEALLKELSA
jgi:hypothetical protein